MQFYIQRADDLRQQVSVVRRLLSVLDELCQTDSGWRPDPKIETKAVESVRAELVDSVEYKEKEIDVITNGPPETVADRLKEFLKNGRPKRRR